MSEEHLIQQIKLGDDNSLKQVYLQYRTSFIPWLIGKYNCTEEEAKDIYQLTILIFYDNIVSGKLTQLTGSLKTYLFSIGKYKWLETKRKQSSIQHETEQFLINTPEEEKEVNTHSEQEIRLISKALQILGDPCKTILELFYYNQLSMDEISQKLNYKNRATTKNLKYKCIKRLQKIYKKEVVKLEID